MTDREFTNDFKYIMQDLYKLYFGAKCSYKEILESDETYVRFKAAEVYRLLGTRVKLSIPAVRKGLFGREQRVFKEEIWKIEDLMALSAQQKQFRGIVISEVQIPKLKLREFAI